VAQLVFALSVDEIAFDGTGCSDDASWQGAEVLPVQQQQQLKLHPH
jgi:hypothetical protein